MKHSKLKIETEIDGVFLLKLPYYTDKRGVFCKIYNFSYDVLAVSFFSKQVAVKINKSKDHIKNTN